MAMRKRGQWVCYKHLYYVFRYLDKVHYTINKFIHAPTFSYNEAVCLLELGGVAKQA